MKLVLARAFFLFALLVAGRAQNVVINLLAPVEAASPGAKVRVDLVVLNPGTGEVSYATPFNVSGTLSNDRRSWPIELTGLGGDDAVVAAHSFSYRAYAFVVPADAQGRLVLEITEPQPARAVIEVKAGDPNRAPRTVSSPLSTILIGQSAESAIQRNFAGRFSVHEPMYFIYGPDAPGAKFQFSFAYRLLGKKGRDVAKDAAIRGLYVGYTQRSLWDIDADSSPFYDTSYMPELLYESQSFVDPGKEGGFQMLGYQFGVRHESNGRDGLNSRSLNIAYFRPVFAFGELGGWNLRLSPRLFTYVSDVQNNPDIADYRGNVELSAIFSRNDSWSLALTGRLGRGGHKGSLQADLTVPVKVDMFFNFATYFMIQYWNGYGESLRGYDRRNETVRAGFSLVR